MPSTPPPTDDPTGSSRRRPELRVLESIRRIIRGIELYSRRLQTQAGVTAPQLVCLGALTASGPLTISQLGRNVHLSASTVVGIVDRLEARGLVLRTRGLTDRRIVTVSATPEGHALAADAPSLLQDRLSQGFARLAADEQASVAAAFERVVALMELEDVQAAPILETGVLPEPEDRPPHPSNE